jgi:hypothetical protein
MTLAPLWDRERCAAPFVYKDGYIVARGYLDRLVLLDGNLYLKETRLPVLGPATAYAKRYSAVMRLALPALAGGARSALRRTRPEQAPPSAADYEPTVRNLAAARRLAEGSGARFLALLVDDRGEHFRRDRLAVQQRLRALGIPYLAADDLLPGADWPRLRFSRDGHWNAAGHAAAGKALAPWVKTLLEERARAAT